MIEFRNVGKRYPDGTIAVGDFSLIVPSYSITVLVGSSGSGKTTLLRMVNRMVDPTSGQVLIDDEDVATVDPVALRRRIGYVMQEAGLLPHRTVVDNIALVLRLGGMSKSESAERALKMMDLVGLDGNLARRWPSQLSGGQRQRVGVARALAHNPNIALMDEPFGATDPLVRADLQTELLRIHDELATTIVFVTHDIEEALLLGDQIVILQKGGVVAQVGTPAEILANPADEFVAGFVGVDRGKRRLRIVNEGGRSVVVDAKGRATGILE